MSFLSFGLSEPILRALEGLGYVEPTEVQQKVIPILLENKDMTVKAQTGSGKTAAFAIPLCEKIAWVENKPQVLVLTPTRELAVQIKEDFIHIGRFKRLKAMAVYGKHPFEYQRIELKQKNHIVVGTPGRVLDHIRKETLPLDKITHLVIDEADVMLNMGFIDQVEAIIQALPNNRVTLLFSATFPEEIQALTRQYLHKPIDVVVHAEQPIEQLVDHRCIDVDRDDKFQLLVDLTVAENPDTCIVFCNTQEQVNELDQMLADLGYPCDKIHGGMVQEDRFAVMNDFKRGAFRYLIATDVAARGIDVDNVSLVINYELPREKEAYIHRTGRTGRAGKSGRAISFKMPHEQERIYEIERVAGFSIVAMLAPTVEQVTSNQAAFDRTCASRPNLKKQRGEAINQGILKLYFNGGKKKKLRAVDFVGTISKIPGIAPSDIGIITIQDIATYVEILNGKGSLVLKAMKTTTVKGKLLKVHVAKP
jgi:superfamily II DNA/RNA helicase